MSQTSVTNKGQELRRGLFGAAFGTTASILLNVLSVPATAYIVRRLGATNYGEWVTATSLIATAAILTNLGLRRTFVRAVARDPGRVGELVSEQLGTRLVLSVSVASIAVAACFLLRYPPVVIFCAAVASMGLMFACIGTTFSDVLEAVQRFSTIASSNFLAGLLLTGASVLVLWFGGGVVSLSISYLVGPVTSIIVLAIVLRRQRIVPRVAFNGPRSLRLIWEGKHVAAQHISQILSNNVPLLLLPKLIGIEQFGVFSAGVLLVTRLAVLPDSIGTVLFPMIAKSYHHERAAATRLALWGICAAAIAGIGAATVCSIFAGLVARVLFPRSPAECQHVISVTVWALPLMGILAVMSYGLNAADRDAAQAKALFASTPIALLLGVVCSITWGINGACWLLLLRPLVQIVAATPAFAATFLRHLPAVARPSGGTSSQANVDDLSAASSADKVAGAIAFPEAAGVNPLGGLSV